MIKLEQTTSAYPEQYDAFINNKCIGYLRLRHGYFYCKFLPTNEIIYETRTKGRGCFDLNEREFHLNIACLALIEKFAQGGY